MTRTNREIVQIFLRFLPRSLEPIVFLSDLPLDHSFRALAYSDFLHPGPFILTVFPSQFRDIHVLPFCTFLFSSILQLGPFCNCCSLPGSSSPIC
ncbi:hypothetical protein DAI22_11g196700 [Oryza sativa Japonica Group]|nr:hypothetical protein DAI22_11g196700 [Oryza sativa Japonica Group]